MNKHNKNTRLIETTKAKNYMKSCYNPIEPFFNQGGLFIQFMPELEAAIVEKLKLSSMSHSPPDQWGRSSRINILYRSPN